MIWYVHYLIFKVWESKERNTRNTHIIIYVHLFYCTITFTHENEMPQDNDSKFCSPFIFRKYLLKLKFWFSFSLIVLIFKILLYFSQKGEFNIQLQSLKETHGPSPKETASNTRMLYYLNQINLSTKTKTKQSYLSRDSSTLTISLSGDMVSKRQKRQAKLWGKSFSCNPFKKCPIFYFWIFN